MEGGRHVNGFHDNVDLLPTVQELLGTKRFGSYHYDGVSYAGTLLEGTDCSRPYEILTNAPMCARGAHGLIIM